MKTIRFLVTILCVAPEVSMPIILEYIEQDRRVITTESRM